MDLDIVNPYFCLRNLKAELELKHNIKIRVQTIASDLGLNTISNMVLLGALIKNTNIVSLDTLLIALKRHGKEKYYGINKQALLCHSY